MLPMQTGIGEPVMRKPRRIILDAARLRERPEIAEIASDRAHWLVIDILPGDETIAAAHLVGRGYGIFVPGEFVKGRWVNMLPGYIFVQVFGIEHHRSRILSCPGVSDFVYEIGHPSCPFTVPDKFIEALRRKERDSIGERHDSVHAFARANPRKRQRRRRKSLRARERKKRGA